MCIVLVLFLPYPECVPVCNDSAALMFPKVHEVFFSCDHWGNGVEHPLPDARQITQVENVVELGWCGQHFDLEIYQNEGEHSCTSIMRTCHLNSSIIETKSKTEMTASVQEIAIDHCFLMPSQQGRSYQDEQSRKQIKTQYSFIIGRI